MSTPKDTIQRHRNAGRGRKATWIALGTAGLLTVMWLAAPIAGHGRTTQRGHHWRDGGLDGSLAELASELRDHGFWMVRAGFTPAQTERLVDSLEEGTPVFEALDSERAAVVERAADTLGAPVLDPAAIETLRADTQQLAATASDAIFGLMTDVAEDLTPDQRADLVRHWKER